VPSVVPSIRIVKTSPYKGGSRVWSNRYYFNGGTPADAAHWLTLSNAITAVEKTCYLPLNVITEAVGYAAGSDVPVYTHVYSIAGTYSSGANDRATPLSDCALLRWSTAARSTKNHPIYCFTYMHAALYDSTVQGNDKLAGGQKTALQTYATDWVSGFSDGTITAVRATPSGHSVTGSLVEEYVTHRDFPYQSSV
jgi:hypothetical protein